MEENKIISNNTPTPTPNTIKWYIPVKSHLPTPVPSPTCSGMFLY